MFDLVGFIPRAVMQGIPLLFGATGETLTEKSGNLNLGIPGIMYVGGISGVIGAFLYEQSCGGNVVPALALLIPLLGLLAAFAEPIVRVVLGAQWTCCVPYIRLLVLGLAFEPAMRLYQNMLYLKGRTDVVLKLEFVQKPICFALVFAALPFGLAGLCVAKAASTVFMAATNMAAARRATR